MIPKKIHYFWFGKAEKSDLEKECISRFSAFAPDFEIKEWNEENFDVSQHPYTRAAYSEKKWAFVSDYARLKVLQIEGGIYLDTDMWLAKDITELCEQSEFIGKEDDQYISAGIIGVTTENQFIKDCLSAYDNLTTRTPIPKVLTEVYSKKSYAIKVYEPVYFYPFTSESIKDFNKKNAPLESYAVHMWNYSWGHPLAKFFKKVGVYKKLNIISEKLGLKKITKKVLKME